MENRSSLGVPIAIVIAGVLIAGGVYLGDNKAPAGQSAAVANTGGPVYQLDEMEPVSQSEHIRGNKSSKIVIVDYSDLECPFCKMFHWTMEEIMKKYKK